MATTPVSGPQPTHNFDPAVVATHKASMSAEELAPLHERAQAEGRHVDDIIAQKMGAAAHAAGIFIPRRSNRPKANTPGSVPNSTVVTARPDGSTTRVRTDRTDEARAASAAENTPSMTPAEIDEKNRDKREVRIPGAITGSGVGIRSSNVDPHVPTGGVAMIKVEGDRVPNEVGVDGTDRQKKNNRRGGTKARAAHKAAVEVAKNAGPIDPTTGKPQGTAGEKAITERVPTDAAGGRVLTGMSTSPGGLNDEIPTRASVEANTESRGQVPVQFATPGAAPVRGSTLPVDHVARTVSPNPGFTAIGNNADVDISGSPETRNPAANWPSAQEAAEATQAQNEAAIANLPDKYKHR